MIRFILTTQISLLIVITVSYYLFDLELFDLEKDVLINMYFIYTFMSVFSYHQGKKDNEEENI